MKKIIKVIREIIQKYIKIVQKLIITITLLILYIVGFGITLIFIIPFSPEPSKSIRKLGVMGGNCNGYKNIYHLEN